MTTSKVLPRFLAALAHQPAPVLIDLGPVVGSNVSLFAERFACRMHVEDFFSEVERHAQARTREQLAKVLVDRLTLSDESVDGILCWDLFDFLDRAAGRAVAHRLARLVRKGGALHGFFGTTPMELRQYSRFTIEGDDTLRARACPATPMPRTVLLTGDIVKMFEPLVAAESVLLKSNTRESLFRRH